MNKKVAIEIAARIWCDQEMSSVEMDSVLAEEIAQLLADRIDISEEASPLELKKE